ncbi:L,D-transpeptidase family protein [Sphingosinicella terrae]|uniref:L,D-transpeptidase family protein n=1 Tax=Sphingosinicella terrae TaxID=2172047 RepID=UPI0013B3C62F|nr:L,D-transpeptidase family protein [Sphingosinicella terrae]
MAGTIAAALLACAAPASAQSAPQGQYSTILRQSVPGDSDLADFYRGRGYRPLWIRGGDLVGEAQRLARALEGENGSAASGGAGLAAAVARAGGGSPADLVGAELRLTRAALALAAAPTSIDVGMTYVDEALEPRRSRRASGVTIESAGDVRELIEDLEEINPVERQLREAFVAYRLRWGGLPQTRIPAGAALRSGARGARVRALRQRLGLAERGTFDGALAAAVREYKRAHGLGDSAVADAATFTSLNRGASHYERLIRANIARAAALPEDPGRQFILVDAAAARLWMYEDGRPVDSMRVIVGKPTEQTPMMAALLRYAALNPYWNVPPDLARVRAANVLRHGPDWLGRNGFEALSDWSDEAQVVHPSRIDWEAVAAGRQNLRIRQLPGPRNMMGRMKLMMPNRLGIYLHDTPDRQLFDAADRRLSSGCVRVEDIGRLSRWLFGRDLAPSTGEPEERINLRRRVPVFISYLTAAPDDAGGIVFRNDVYGRDSALLAQLGGATRMAAQ